MHWVMGEAPQTKKMAQAPTCRPQPAKIMDTAKKGTHAVAWAPLSSRVLCFAG